MICSRDKYDVQVAFGYYGSNNVNILTLMCVRIYLLSFDQLHVFQYEKNTTDMLGCASKLHIGQQVERQPMGEHFWGTKFYFKIL